MTYNFEKLFYQENIDREAVKIFLEDFDDESKYSDHTFIPKSNEIKDINGYIRYMLDNTFDYRNIRSVHHNLKITIVEDTLNKMGGGSLIIRVDNSLDNETHYYKFDGCLVISSYEELDIALDDACVEVFATPVTVIQYLPKT
jgi:hypothetical protein